MPQWATNTCEVWFLKCEYLWEKSKQDNDKRDYLYGRALNELAFCINLVHGFLYPDSNKHRLEKNGGI